MNGEGEMGRVDGLSAGGGRMEKGERCVSSYSRWRRSGFKGCKHLLVGASWVQRRMLGPLPIVLAQSIVSSLLNRTSVVKNPSQHGKTKFASEM